MIDVLKMVEYHSKFYFLIRLAAFPAGGLDYTLSRMVKTTIAGRLAIILFLIFVLRTRFQVSVFRIYYCANLS